MSKPNHNRLGIYADVREVADMALTHRGGSYDCADLGAAINFSHRFYRFRQLYRDIYHGDSSSCKYDTLVLPRVKTPTVVFKIREPLGTFRPAGGTSAIINDDDELFNIATQLAAKLKGDN